MLLLIVCLLLVNLLVILILLPFEFLNKLVELVPGVKIDIGAFTLILKVICKHILIIALVDDFLQQIVLLLLLFINDLLAVASIGIAIVGILVICHI